MLITYRNCAFDDMLRWHLWLLNKLNLVIYWISAKVRAWFVSKNQAVVIVKKPPLLINDVFATVLDNHFPTFSQFIDTTFEKNRWKNMVLHQRTISPVPSIRIGHELLHWSNICAGSIFFYLYVFKLRQLCHAGRASRDKHLVFALALIDRFYHRRRILRSEKSICNPKVVKRTSRRLNGI